MGAGLVPVSVVVLVEVVVVTLVLELDDELELELEVELELGDEDGLLEEEVELDELLNEVLELSDDGEDDDEEDDDDEDEDEEDEDGELELEEELEELEVLTVGMVSEKLDKEVDDDDKEVELVEGTVMTVTEVLTEVLEGELELDELEVSKKSDVVVKDVVGLVVVNESKMVSDVVVLSSVVVVVGVSISVPHTPLQATICPLTHSVPAAVGPKLMRPPWSQTKKVVPSGPQNIWPSGAQSP